MKPMGLMGVPHWWMGGAHLAKVVAVDDPARLGRVRITLLAEDPDDTAEIWARVAVPFAADNCGAFLIPDVDEEVVVIFVGNSPEAAIVVGSLWNGKTTCPETLPGTRVDRWTITGKAGTRIAIVESAAGQEQVVIETPNGASATITDASGQSIKLEAAGNTITLDTSGVTVQAAANVTVTASKVDVTAGQVSVSAAMSQFSGVVQCDTLIANTVVGAAYTPGAGNIW